MDVLTKVILNLIMGILYNRFISNKNRDKSIFILDNIEINLYYIDINKSTLTTESVHNVVSCNVR